MVAFDGRIGHGAYGAAKAGTAGMALTMARELGTFGFRSRALAIAPSLFNPGLTVGITEELAASLTKDAAFPQRMGPSEGYTEFAVAIVESQMLNGGAVRLNGGQRFAPRP